MSEQPTDPCPDCTLTDLGTEPMPLDDGWVAAEAVDADGSRSYWLLDPDTDDDVCHPLPAHEMEGPLPDDVAARVRQVPS